MSTSYTFASPEAMTAMYEAFSHAGKPYLITVAGDWTQDYAVLHRSLTDAVEGEHAAADLLDELAEYGRLTLGDDQFEVLAQALLARWEDHGDDAAGGMLSSIAGTLGVEFI
jgi:hypothetical protein